MFDNLIKFSCDNNFFNVVGKAILSAIILIIIFSGFLGVNENILSVILNFNGLFWLLIWIGHLYFNSNLSGKKCTQIEDQQNKK